MILALLLLVADPCEMHGSCTGTEWELRISGHQIAGLGDMTKDECIAAAKELAPQTPPNTLVQCVQTGVARLDM